MSLYDGPNLASGGVSLRAPDPSALASLIADADLTDDQKGWLERAADDESMLYFAISLVGQPVGQIMLHDIDRDAGVALVGYHIFRTADRGSGTGTMALRLISHHALATLGLRRLVAITGVENLASRRIAEKCGYVCTGAAREGEHLVVYELVASDDPHAP
jgi:RimJ/RimL family protein N-acetyltransferase